MKKLDRKRPFAEIHGLPSVPGARFVQDRIMFDRNGYECLNPGQVTQPEPEEPEVEEEPRELTEDEAKFQQFEEWVSSMKGNEGKVAIIKYMEDHYGVTLENLSIGDLKQAAIETVRAKVFGEDSD